MNNKQILGALSLDLKRVAIGYFRGSAIMSQKFFEEAMKRRDEIDNTTLKPYLVKFLNDMENLKNKKDDRAAEDALLYSTIFQNASMIIS
jgi:hypothetical protein